MTITSTPTHAIALAQLIVQGAALIREIFASPSPTPTEPIAEATRTIITKARKPYKTDNSLEHALTMRYVIAVHGALHHGPANAERLRALCNGEYADATIKRAAQILVRAGKAKVVQRGRRGASTWALIDYNDTKTTA